MKSFVSSVVLQKKVPLWKRHTCIDNIHVVTFDHKRRQMSHDKAMTYMYERISRTPDLLVPLLDVTWQGPEDAGMEAVARSTRLDLKHQHTVMYR